MRRGPYTWLVLLAAIGPAGVARADGFDAEFGGGALIPEGPLAERISPGLDVGGRVGWSARSGLGVVLALDYAPLKQKFQPDGEMVDGHLFAGSLGPRFTFGKSFVRAWLAADAGVLLERTAVQAGGGTTVTVDTNVSVGGQGGVDFLFFDSGGLSLAGAYTHAVKPSDGTQYLAFTAGLLILL